ncbi:MAG: S8 family serine peptidase [Salinivirgaceae bacterium]|jgi:subtilisin family serine protease|nr:S8 family serine peptidase [Salinivirgaceae bacterium]
MRKIYIILLLSITSTMLIAQSDLGKTIKVKFDEQTTSLIEKNRENKNSISINDFNSIAKQNSLSDLVRFSKKSNIKSLKRVFRYAGKFEEKHRKYGLNQWYEIHFSEVKETGKTKEILESIPQVLHAESPAEFKLLEEKPTKNFPNDPKYTQQWQYVSIGMDMAWQYQTGSKNVVVAVNDGGIDVDHEDISGNVWRNTNEIPNNGVDDDNNGYIDDYYGYNFADDMGEIVAHDHGTHVAGSIAGETNNGIGISGVAGGNGYDNGVRLMSLALFSENNIDGFDEAFVYAADMGAVISQNSWGSGPQVQSLEDAIQYFIANAGGSNAPMDGGLVVFAAGNDNVNQGESIYPASLPYVMAVSSIDRYDKKSTFSNYGEFVDICAPGSFIFSSISENSYQSKSGTSMACPHVSGVAALVVSQYEGNITPRQVWDHITTSADPIDQVNPNYIGNLGAGRLNAFGALGIIVENYCESNGSGNSEWIEKIKIGEFENQTGDNNGYGSFVYQNIALTGGESYPIQLTPGFNSSSYNEYWKIWIDFNKNKIFESTEEVYSSNGGYSTEIQGSITIPVNVTGQTRMRVSMKYSSSPTACEVFSYGEVEDYTITLTPGTINYYVDLISPAQAQKEQVILFGGNTSPGVAYIKTWIDGYQIAVEPVTNNAFSFTSAFNTPGVNRELTTKAYDLNNNLVAEDTDYITITDGTQESAISINSSGTVITGSPASFLGTVTSDIADVKLYADQWYIGAVNSANGSYEMSYTFNTAGVGRKITAKGYNSQNVEVANAFIYIDVVDQISEITINHASSVYTNEPVTFSGTCISDIYRAVVKADQWQIKELYPANGTYEFQYNFNTAALDRTITATGYDISGNVVGQVSSKINIYSGSKTNLEEFSANEFSIFPNPAKDAFTIKTNSSNNYTVIILSIAGSKVYEKATAGSLNMHISGLKPGIYIVKVQAQGNIEYSKLIIE